MIPKADTSDFKKLEKLMHNFPKLLRPVMAKTLNKQVQDMKFIHIPNALEDAMEIRDERFMNRQIRFTKAKPTSEANLMFSEVGSVEKGEFTAWEEQQTGKRSELDRTSTTESRVGGTFKGRMKGAARFKPNNPIRKTSDYQGPRLKTKNQQVMAMLKESRDKKLSFMIRKQDSTFQFNKLKPGLYGWQGNKLVRYQLFDKHYDPGKMDWMGKALKMLGRKRGPFERIYAKEMDRMIKSSGLT